MTSKQNSRSRSNSRARRVLFVDFDGVLQPGPDPRGMRADSAILRTGHFGWLPVLVALLRPHPDVGVVVSSSWREVYDELELIEILSELRGKVLGATPKGPRYDSILRWLDTHPKWSDFRILDDDVTEFPTPLPLELIVCDPNEGVTGAEVQAALRQWLQM